MMRRIFDRPERRCRRTWASRKEKARPVFRLGLFLLQQSASVNSANQIVADATDNDHGWDGPE
jgi:hypothetical protein